MPEGKVALVFGASGISGWAFVNQCLEDYPRKGVWDGVVALTNRPLSREQSNWPDDDRLNIVSGIDLLEGSQQDVEGKLAASVPRLDQITHVMYMGKPRTVSSLPLGHLH
jgi:nucleoside-diphosphate-sugar epimerase